MELFFAINCMSNKASNRKLVESTNLCKYFLELVRCKMLWLFASFDIASVAKLNLGDFRYSTFSTLHHIHHFTYICKFYEIVRSTFITWTHVLQTLIYWWFLYISAFSLHQRIEEHKSSVIGKYLKEIHGVGSPDIRNMFSVLKKCQGKLDC